VQEDQEDIEDLMDTDDIGVNLEQMELTELMDHVVQRAIPDQQDQSVIPDRLVELVELVVQVDEWACLHVA